MSIVILRGASAFAPEVQGLCSCQQCHPADSNFKHILSVWGDTKGLKAEKEKRESDILRAIKDLLDPMLAPWWQMEWMLLWMNGRRDVCISVCICENCVHTQHSTHISESSQLFFSNDDNYLCVQLQHSICVKNLYYIFFGTISMIIFKINIVYYWYFVQLGAAAVNRKCHISITV